VPDPDRNLAEAIIAARREGRCLPAQVGAGAITPDRAYRIQSFITSDRLARGQRIVGWKLGYTSTAMRDQMGIAEPNIGPLTDAMLLPGGASVPDSVIQPKVEPEIALVLGSDVSTAMPADEIRGSVVSAHAALEVVDSIWCDYRFTWADNTADGSSAAFVVVGDQLPTDDLTDLVVDLSRNGDMVGTGRGADAMGDPFDALAWLSGRLAESGAALRSGDVVITGGLCPAVDLRTGDVVRASFAGVDVSVRRDPFVPPDPSGCDGPGPGGSL
jgi:2-keto-4-pentenoate hydratase